MQFYRERGVYSVQGQAVGASLQIGHRIWGVLPDSWFSYQGRRKNGPAKLWLRCVIMAPPADDRIIFEFSTRWFRFSRKNSVLHRT